MSRAFLLEKLELLRSNPWSSFDLNVFEERSLL
nr:MAG TPA: hypothetical protein [Caudoviricetes sp.]